MYLFHLKSNMDRFIAYTCELIERLEDNLKSNMDRFIADPIVIPFMNAQTFKIQYG